MPHSEAAPISMPPEPSQEVTGSKTGNQSKYMYGVATDSNLGAGIMARK